jgi:hypothetical protein
MVNSAEQLQLHLQALAMLLDTKNAATQKS